MINLGPLFEYKAHTVKFKMTKARAINRSASFAARKFAPDSLLKQYATMRAKVQQLKQRIQMYHGRGMAVARRMIK